MDQKKKMAAAIAAVSAYIQTEEALCMQATAPAGGAATAPPAPAGPTNLWGLSGRQTLMQMGTMMQMKAFHRP